MQSTVMRTSRSLICGAIAGAVVGFLMWWMSARELQSRFTPDQWLGHVLSSPINAVSFVAFGSAVGQLLARWTRIFRERRGMSVPLLGGDPDTLLLPDDVKTTRKHLGDIEPKMRDTVPVRLLTVGLLRAKANWSAADVSTAIVTEADLVQEAVELCYSNVRYLAWSIPSIGFIGTVLGIGWAMGDMNFRGGDDYGDPLAAAARHLSMAFDTTFVALVLSLAVMFLLQRVESADDRMLTQAKSWCLTKLPLRMHAQSQET